MSRNWSRRRFLQTIGSGTAVLTLTACGQQAPVTQSPTDGAQAPQPTGAAVVGTPQRGGMLRVVFSGSISQFDPALLYTEEESNVIWSLYNRLTYVQEDGTVLPELATSWESSPDGLQWVFKLREGVTFHNGASLSAEDVAYTFKRLLDPEMRSVARNMLRVVNDIVAVDKLTVRFDLSRPSVDFPILLNFPATSIVPNGKSSEELTKQPIGTGPFSFVEYVPGERLRMARNEKYWQPDQPYLDELVFEYISEPETRLQALMSGTVDAIYNLSLEQVAMIQATPELQLLEVSEASFQPILLNQQDSALQDNRVREALKLCVDRKGILQVATQGHGSIANDQPVPPWNTLYAAIPAHEQNFEQAKALLAEAGHADGLTLKMVTAPLRPGMVETAVAFQEMAKQAGVTIELERLPSDTYWSDYLKYPLAMSNANYNPLSLDAILALYYHSDGVWNEPGYKNPELDKLIEQASAETNLEQRTKLYAQLQQVISDEGACIISYYRSFFAAVRRAAHDLHVTRHTMLDTSVTWVEQKG